MKCSNTALVCKRMTPLIFHSLLKCQEYNHFNGKLGILVFSKNMKILII